MTNIRPTLSYYIKSKLQFGKVILHILLISYCLFAKAYIIIIMNAVQWQQVRNATNAGFGTV